MREKGRSGRGGVWRRRKALIGGREGSQLIELALSLPLLIIMVIAITDFGRAFNIKQELNNAAREGARYAANQSSNILDAETGAAATAVGNVVQNYLTNAGLSQCTFTAPGSPTLTYSYSGSPSGCGLEIVRNYDATGTATVVSTHVMISYPYTWTLTKIIKMFLPNATLSLPTTISTDAIMPNIN